MTLPTHKKGIGKQIYCSLFLYAFWMVRTTINGTVGKFEADTLARYSIYPCHGQTFGSRNIEKKILRQIGLIHTETMTDIQSSRLSIVIDYFFYLWQ